ncbi:MAG: hypothetical protein B7Z15_23085, partial [Rhizobiales bacterium 32-66-8]
MIRRLLTIMLAMLLWTVQTADAAIDHGKAFGGSDSATVMVIADHGENSSSKNEGGLACNAGCICHVFHHACLGDHVASIDQQLIDGQAYVLAGLSRAVAGVALMISLAGPAWAQSGSVLTLPEALARAEAQAPALAEAKAAVDAARGRTQQAGFSPNPEARLEVENFSGSGLYTGLDLAETTLAIGQTIEMGGKRESRIAAGNAEIVAAETRQIIARADLGLEVRRLFAIALASREQVALAQGALDRARDLAKVAQTLVDTGREPPLRALRARSAAAEAEAELQRVASEDSSARAALAALLGDTVA